MSKIYVTGISGTGKSTLSRELIKKGIMSLDIDAIPDLCHWRNKIIGKSADYRSGIGRDWIRGT